MYQTGCAVFYLLRGLVREAGQEFLQTAVIDSCNLKGFPGLQGEIKRERKASVFVPGIYGQLSCI